MTHAIQQPSLKTSGDSNSACRWWMLLLIALIAMAAYANSMRNSFAFDDVAVVEGNARVLNLDGPRSGRTTIKGLRRPAGGHAVSSPDDLDLSCQSGDSAGCGVDLSSDQCGPEWAGQRIGWRF